jgi:hypothetical protein
VILLLNTLSINPEDMPEGMLRRQSWTRIQRFTATARYDTVHARSREPRMQPQLVVP